ncbi:hypothetical protein BPMI_03807 [Candidatus Burkholderia pumila]|uniref:Glycosyl hydrolase family 95 catalytic domain-containing protein n=1 Tax=Candidatus Burkholderia pumila TaxID=1090375 RepID=A0ABR5HLK6_9BURK|nr:hypothetical protein BPMI_03807 [Candidatus Burkholderia pumila]
MSKIGLACLIMSCAVASTLVGCGGDTNGAKNTANSTSAPNSGAASSPGSSATPVPTSSSSAGSSPASNAGATQNGSPTSGTTRVAIPVSGAWDGKRFAVDVSGVVSRSNIVLSVPNVSRSEAMPLGNGRLGAAVWSEAGLTAQLNRSDTLPNRLSPGQIVVPGLAKITKASDYKGVLDLYNGEFREAGGGMTATAYMQPDTDALIIDVTGANPTEPQTAVLELWSPRTPTATTVGTIGVLSESWKDGVAGDSYGGSGQAFGSLAAVHVMAHNVSAKVTSSVPTTKEDPSSLDSATASVGSSGLTPITSSITLTFTPNVDGSFRIIVGAPHYDGSQSVASVAASSTADVLASAHSQSWNAFWARAGLIRLTSQDGSGEYMENLRNIYLYSSEAQNKDTFPGSQAGVADLFSSLQDYHRWDPAAYWHWNLRMQTAANLSAGLDELNAPYFNLYRVNLDNIMQWTSSNLAGRPGACVPETMRFNGNGLQIHNGGRMVSNCSAIAPASYNARTLTTGAEVSHFIWQQYLATDDSTFLQRNYPVIASAAHFLLAYQSLGTDGLLHTAPTNAHETQWDVRDSTTDIAAARTLYTDLLNANAVIKTISHQTIDTDLEDAAAAALLRIPDYPRTATSGTLSLIALDADAVGKDVIADSYQPGAPNHNSENIGLEPVWPYDQIGDTSPLFALAQRTYLKRKNVANNDWNFDPIDAARLRMPTEVESTLIRITKRYQKFLCGFAQFMGAEPYLEQVGVVAAALSESLVQDYDGVVRIAPATPVNWDYDGTVFVRGLTKVDVQVRHGVPSTVVIEPSSNTQLIIRNPWPGQKVIAFSESFATPIQLTGDNLTLQLVNTSPIFLQGTGSQGLPVTPVSGTAPTEAKHLGPVQIGL